MWNLDKLYRLSYLQSRNSHICREQIYNYQGWERGWDEVELTYIYITHIKYITNENLLHSTGNSMLCGDLNEKKIPTRGYMYTYTYS